jgi:hypothetical protein
MTDITVWMWTGFLLAAYSVIANDSIQTLGTWIASNKKVNWKYMWGFASTVLLIAIWYGWWAYDGDISYGRLNKIPFEGVEWYQALAPAVLLVLTRFGVPVSTSFLVLSAFASTLVLQKVLMKSMLGYAVAGVAAYFIWLMLTRLIDEGKSIKDSHKKWWSIGQWVTTGFLWWTWLSHDMANIAVYLPRQIPVEVMFIISAVFVAGLAWMLQHRGGKIQDIVVQKKNTRYVRSATLIDLFYFVILYIFKEVNDIPMSTTWVFVGLLTGRELAIASFRQKEGIKKVFPIVGRDFLKLMVGLAASVGIVLIVQYAKG